MPDCNEIWRKLRRRSCAHPQCSTALHRKTAGRKPGRCRSLRDGKNDGRTDCNRKTDYENRPAARWICFLPPVNRFPFPLMAITMIQMGVSAVSLNAWQVPDAHDLRLSERALKRIDTERIRKELDDNKIVIVTGFQGSTNTMISPARRGGSDTTVWLPSLQSCTRMSVKSTRM